MPEMSGIQAAVRLTTLYPRLKVIFVTQQLDLSYVRAAYRAGAAGYVCKQSASNEILMAIEKVLRGGVFTTPLLAQELSLSPEEFARDPRQGVRRSADGTAAPGLADGFRGQNHTRNVGSFGHLAQDGGVPQEQPDERAWPAHHRGAYALRPGAQHRIVM